MRDLAGTMDRLYACRYLSDVRSRVFASSHSLVAQYITTPYPVCCTWHSVANLGSRRAMPASAEGGLRRNDTIQPVKSQYCSLDPRNGRPCPNGDDGADHELFWTTAPRTTAGDTILLLSCDGCSMSCCRCFWFLRLGLGHTMEEDRFCQMLSTTTAVSSTELEAEFHSRRDDLLTVGLEDDRVSGIGIYSSLPSSSLSFDIRFE
jgi:hypothetical protein